MTIFQPRAVMNYFLTSDELDTLVNDYLKPSRTYEAVPENEWDNDSNYSATTEFYDPEDDARRVKDWVDGINRYAPSVSTLLGELAKLGVIPEGDYMIEVSW